MGCFHHEAVTEIHHCYDPQQIRLYDHINISHHQNQERVGSLDKYGPGAQVPGTSDHLRSKSGCARQPNQRTHLVDFVPGGALAGSVLGSELLLAGSVQGGPSGGYVPKLWFVV